MFKKLLTASILLATSLLMTVSISANASFIKGSFDIAGVSRTTLNTAGEITKIAFF